MFKKLRFLLAFLLIITLSSCSIAGIGGLPDRDYFHICVRNSSELKVYGIGLIVNINEDSKNTTMAQNADNTELDNDYINFAFKDVPTDEDYKFSFQVEVKDENGKKHTVGTMQKLDIESEKVYYFSFDGDSFDNLELKSDPEPTPTENK